ncbi:MAG: hypothetical protein M3Y60_13090 [Bacteroidota bacterium]|nr:hypothetical protein [Bacteroidota bacterium]
MRSKNRKLGGFVLHEVNNPSRVRSERECIALVPGLSIRIGRRTEQAHSTACPSIVIADQDR